jgi:hypothetical protein
VPLTDLVPDHPPEAVQLVALLVVQFKVELPPLVIDVGLAVRFTVGAGGGAVTVTVAEAELLPPDPVHVNVYIVVVVSAPVDCEPLVD